MAGWVAGEGWRQEKPVTSFRRMELTSAIKVNAKIRERSEDQMCCAPCARRQQAGAPSCSGEWEAVRGLRGAGGGELTWDKGAFPVDQFGHIPWFSPATAHSQQTGTNDRQLQLFQLKTPRIRHVTPQSKPGQGCERQPSHCTWVCGGTTRISQARRLPDEWRINTIT